VAGITAGLSPHITVWASVLGSYSPPYQVNVFPGVGQATIGQATVLPVDNSLSTSHLFAYGTSTGLAYNVTKRSSFTLGHEFREVRFGERAFAGRVQDASGAFHVGLTKGLGFHLGYRYQRYDYIDPTTAATIQMRADSLDIGLDYGAGHGLKLSRRTTANFNFGIATYTDRSLNRLQLRAVGNASLRHQLFRTWSLRLVYNRGLTFIDGFRLPVFSDMVSINVAGQLTQRVAAYGNLGYSLDKFGTATSSGSYRSHRGVLGLRANLTRQLDGFVQYVNYHHGFPDTALVLEGLPVPNRRGVNGGLTFTLPLLGRQRPVPRGPS
jgi:hypothetical protein